MALPLRVGIRVPACAPIDRVAATVRLAEDVGYDSAWLPDSQLIWRDTWMALALAAGRTERITLATAVTNVVTRHPSVIASATRTLQEIAPDRVLLGLGAAWSAAGMIGAKQATSTELRDAYVAIRDLLDGKPVTFNGVPGELRGATGAPTMYLGAGGPRNLRLAGEIADGVILTQAATAANVSARLEPVRESGRRIDVVAWAAMFPTDDLDRDVGRLKPAAWIALRNQTEAEVGDLRAGLSLGDVPAGIEPDGTHVADWELAVTSCADRIPDEVARAWAAAWTITGDAAAVRARAGELAAAGATTLLLTPLGGDSNQTLPDEFLQVAAEALGL